MCNKLNEIKGFSCQKPNGAFYAFQYYWNRKKLTQIQNILLDDIGVATVVAPLLVNMVKVILGYRV